MKKERDSGYPVLEIISFIMIGAIIFSFLYIHRQTESINRFFTNSYQEYDRHYVLITDDFEDSFWEEAYRYAKEYAAEETVCLEWFGKELGINGSKADLLKAAIAANVDGIILEGDSGGDTRELIKEADAKGIPVVLALTDCYESGRKSFVGPGSYNLGREYGRQIVRIATKETKKVLVFMALDAEEKGQNIILNGIKETLANEGNHLELEMETMVVDGSADFFWGTDGIKTLLENGETPDIIICLDEKNTADLCQAVVEYNCVGQVDILGYSQTDYVINAVNREVLQATLAVNASQLGISCIQALNEYMETGYVSDFLTVDVNAVTLRNAEEYLKDAEEKE